MSSPGDRRAEGAPEFAQPSRQGATSTSGVFPVAAAAVADLSQELIAWFKPALSYVVALSGGVDSAVVAKAAKLSGVSASAATARSPSVSAVELSDVRRLVDQLQIPHEFIDTREVLDANYRVNDARRCYYCKSTLFSAVRSRFSDAIILTGTNWDDLGDYRPGLTAAQEASVQSPLVDLQIGKQQVRQLAEFWQLHVAEKPASPCLASRIAHGVPVTETRLAMVEQAEGFLRGLGLTEFRVRLHADEVARLEVAPSAISWLASPEISQQITAALKSMGFRFVTLDLEGFRSGSLNPVFQIDNVNSGTRSR
ncbi:ATP-dependent sacrificial sulfur transferase LarE [Aureliella helgolandensis]|uniref:tRNA-specific 2-thiouridylase MnmA n=1 Tax=Aureliella helgolandensis TaxID=2527968 RepID=A0A518GE50_9BACT|nr:ATP-dependent sacrificial sulfur transferase LarE [Aureliella helgolandensis]QDV26876.1 tRNA-specific 2-thiouridylase MnmA [Aureliella helgolandensis]